MTQDGGTSERIYAKLKAALLAGTLSAHTRLDFAELAEEFGVSTTPIREATMRLLGEGLLQSNARGGAHPVLASEVRLRALFDLHAKLSLAAIDWQVWPFDQRGIDRQATHEQQTRSFFVLLARATANPELEDIVERLSDRLAPFRRHEEALISDGGAELAILEEALTDRALLRRSLRSYHKRRSGLVARLVWMVNSPPS